MKTIKTLLTVLLCIFFPLGILYLLALRCRRGKEWPKPLLNHRYAHRGLHHQPDAPENSLAAFKKAIEHGYGAELDIHLMKDGNLAVIHDSSLLRTAGADVMIEDLTAEDLKDYRLEGTDEKIPLFEEVLELFDGKTPLIVELKAARGNHNVLTSAACAVLDKYNVTYCIESFDPRCLVWLKNNRPDIIRGQLSGNMTKEKTGYNPVLMWALKHLLTNFTTVPDFIAYDHRYRDIGELKLCRVLYGVQEFAWTVRSAEKAAELEKDGCFLIFEKFLA